MATNDGRLTPTAEAPTATVSVRGLIRGYGPKGVLNGVDLDISPGEFVALLGPSGCGKSTLLRALAGLDHEVSGSGTVTVPAKVSVVFQDSRLLPWDSVLGNVTLGLQDHDAEIAAAVRSPKWDSPDANGPGRISFPAVSSSVLRWPDPWSAIPNCCWRTNLSAPWMR
jgi:ABC-type multidrug transport system fused ATPase/permease subunit